LPHTHCACLPFHHAPQYFLAAMLVLQHHIKQLVLNDLTATYSNWASSTHINTEHVTDLKAQLTSHTLAVSQFHKWQSIIWYLYVSQCAVSEHCVP
jgi:hypothetical protein